MKKLLTSGMLAGLAINVLAQGQIYLQNSENTDTSPSATSNGLFFFDTDGPGPNAPFLANHDFNVSFYGGSDANNLVLLRTFAGTSAQFDNAFGAGTFADPTDTPATIPGAMTTAVLKIEAWTGSATTYSSALLDPSAIFTLGNIVFTNHVALAPDISELTGMPGIVLTRLPEPSTYALAGFGAALFWFFRRTK